MPLHPQAQAFLKMQESLSLPDITTDLMKYREASHNESDLAVSNAANVQIAQFAKTHGVQFVNHTFTSHSALAASMQPYAGMKESWMAEYPMEPKLLCVELNDSKILPDKDGMISVPEQPGVGVSFSPSAISKYLVDVEIVVNKKTLYRTPTI